MFKKINGNVEEDDRESYKLIGKDFYEWKIEDWNGIRFNKYEESPEIDLCGHKWYIFLFILLYFIFILFYFFFILYYFLFYYYYYYFNII